MFSYIMRIKFKDKSYQQTFDTFILEELTNNLTEPYFDNKFNFLNDINC